MKIYVDTRLSLAVIFIAFYASIFAQTEEVRIKGAYLKIESGSTATISGSVTVLNDYDSGILKVKSGGVVNADGNVNIVNSASVQVDGQLNVKGNWTNNATASTALAGATIGTVQFTGTLNQNIGGSSVTTFEAFGINNSAGVTLTSNQTIANTLTFSSGIISTGAFRLDMTNTAADNTSGYGTGNYVLGNFRRYVTTNVDYTFPIGSAANFEQAGIFVVSQTGLSYVDATFTVGAVANPGGLTVNGASIDQFLDYGKWTFTPNAGVTAVNYHPLVQSIGHTNLGGTQDNYCVVSNVGAGWQSIGNHSNTTQQYSATTVLAKRHNLTTFGSYTVAHTATVTYTAPAVTEEVRNKTTYIKTESGSTATASGSTTALNNYDSGVLKVKSGGVMTCEGNFTNANSASVQVDGQFNSQKDWINNATASVALAGATTGTIQFNGTTNQNIGGTSTTIFEIFSINNSAGVTLTSNQTVSNTLAFSSGIITTGAFRLDMTNTTADLTSGYGAGKFVYGNFRRYVTTNVDYTFPIGSATTFEMAGIYVVSQTGLTYVDATFTTGNQNPAPGGLTVNGVAIANFLDYGKWTFAPNAGVASVRYHPSVQSMGHTDLGGTQDNYCVVSDVGSGWQSLGSHSYATQTYSATTVLAKRHTLTAFGSYVIGHTATPIYIAPTVTEEVRNKTTYLKTESGSITTSSGATTALNNYDSGILKVKSGGVLSSDGNFTNANSASVQVDGQFNANKNWTNNATASVALAGGTVGTIQLSGTTNQNIGGTTATTFEGLTINNSAGVTLTSNQTVANTLTFSSGIVTTGAFRLDMTNTTADNTTGSGTGKYVFGNFRRYVTTGVDYTFPIGDATNYEQAGIFVVSQTGLNYIDVGFVTGNQNPAPGGLTVNGVTIASFLNYGKWTFTPNAGVTAVKYHPAIQSMGHTDLGGNQDNYCVVTDVGSGWQSLGLHSYATQIYSATAVLAKRHALTAFGSYVVGYTATPIYTPPTVTEEVRNKTTYVKTESGGITTSSGATTALNNYDSGILKVKTGGVLTSDGNFTNANSASVQVDGQFNAKKDWTNNATASVALAGATVGTVQFNGTANQNIGGTTATTFEGFTVNNSAGVTLTTNQTVANGLSFSAGIITTGAFRLDMTNTTADYTLGSGTGKYVYGNFRRYVTTNVEYIFPIGNATNYEEAGIFVVSQTGLNYIDVSFVTGNQNPAPGGLTVNGVAIANFLDYGKWTFTPNAGVTAVKYHPSVQSTGHTDLGGTQDNYCVVTDVGSGWQSLGLHSYATQIYSTTTVLAKRHALTAFGSYVVGHTNTPIYTPPTVTEEVRNKTTYIKTESGGITTSSGATTALNNYDSGFLKVKSGGVLTTDGNFTNANSATVQVDGQFNVKKDWTNNATASLALASATIGTVEFNGTANQNIGGTTVTSFEGLSMNNAAGVTLTTNQTIANGLSFSAGKITTGAFRLDMTNITADNTSGYGTGKYVYGNFRRYVTTGVEYTFPIGNATNYEQAGIFIVSQSGLNYIDVSFVTGNQNPAPGGLTVNGVAVADFLDYGKWTFTPNAGVASVNYHPTVQSIGHTDLGGTQDYYCVITDIGAGWQSLGLHSSATQSYTTTTVMAKRHALTSFGSYVIGHTNTPIYVPPAVTEEVRNKTVYLKAQANATAAASGSTTVLNNYNSGILKALTTGTITAEGDLNNMSSSTIAIDGQINIKGNYTNNATVSMILAGGSAGTVQFNGAAANLGGTAVTTFENIIVNSSSNVTLTNDITVNNTITWTGGKIVLGTRNINLANGANAAAGTPSSTKHIVATGTGNVIQSFTGTGTTYTYPLGDGTNYTPCTFKLNSGTLAAATVGFNTTDADPPAIVGATAWISRYWTTTPTGISGTINYDMSYTYIPADVVGVEATIIPAKYSGGAWSSGGGAPVSQTLTWNGITSFSIHSGINSSFLPITLLSFKAVKNNDVVDLIWKTATETNNDYFTIEKTNDGVNFETVVKVKGAGTSSKAIDYKSVDPKPYKGISYYRLKQTDFDGKYTYSQLEVVDFSDVNRASEFTVFPNPSNGDFITVKSNLNFKPLEEIIISIKQINGQEVYSSVINAQKDGTVSNIIYLEQRFASGSYIVTGTTKEKTYHQMLIIQ